MGNRGWGDFGLAAAELIGARKVSGGELSQECRNGMFLRLDWRTGLKRRAA